MQFIIWLKNVTKCLIIEELINSNNWLFIHKLLFSIKIYGNKLNRKRKCFEIEQNQIRKEEEDNTNKIKEKKESDSEVSIRKD